MTPKALAALLDRCTPATLFQVLYDSGYTGPILLHCAGGVPRIVEIPERPPAPVRIALVVDPPPPERDLTPSVPSGTLSPEIG